MAKPDGLLVVPPEEELVFLHPLVVERLWGVGPVTAQKLRQRGIRTVGEVAGFERDTLVAMLGAGTGRHLHALAHNQDPRRVQVGRRRGSIGSQQALGSAGRSPAVVDAALVALADRVAHRLRGAHRVGRTIVLRLRFRDTSPLDGPGQRDDANARSRTLDSIHPRPHTRPSRPTIGRCQGGLGGQMNAADLHRQWQEAVNATDLDAFIQLYDPEARVLLPDGATLEGREAIRATYAELFAQGTPSVTLTTRFASELGDLALLSCSWEGVVAGEKAAGITAEVARRQPDGRWAFLIDNPWAAPAE